MQNEGKKGQFRSAICTQQVYPREKFDHFRKLFIHRSKVSRHSALSPISFCAQEENRRSGPISHAKAPQGIGVPKGAIRLQNKGLNTRKRDLAREGLNAFGQKRGPFALFRLIALFRLSPYFALLPYFISLSLTQSNKRLSCGYIREKGRNL